MYSITVVSLPKNLVHRCMTQSLAEVTGVRKSFEGIVTREEREARGYLLSERLESGTSW